MAEAGKRAHEGPTDEVGSEGGSPGELEVDRDADILAGSERRQSVTAKHEDVDEHDHQLERDGRPAPRP